MEKKQNKVMMVEIPKVENLPPENLRQTFRKLHIYGFYFHVLSVHLKRSFFFFLHFPFGMWDWKHHKEVSHRKKQKLQTRIHELFQRYVR